MVVRYRVTENMKKIKRRISVVLVFLLCLTGFPLAVGSAQTSSESNISDFIEVSKNQYVIAVNGEWSDCGEESAQEIIRAKQDETVKIKTAWSLRENDQKTSISNDDFFNFYVPATGEKYSFDLKSNEGFVVGEVSVDADGRGIVAFSQKNAGEEASLPSSGEIEIALSAGKYLESFAMPSPQEEAATPALPQEETEAPTASAPEPSQEEAGVEASISPLSSSITPLGSTYTVNYCVNINGRDTIVNSFENLSEGSIIPECTYDLPSLGGKVFLYWYDKRLSPSQPFDMDTRVTEDLTLVAYYDNAHYVTFMSDGADIDDQLVNDGEKAQRPAQNPTRKGYTFLRWSLTEGGSTAFNFEGTPITEHTTLYAVWKAEQVNYRILFWREKPNLPENFDHTNHANYDYVYEDTAATFTKTAGTNVTVSKAEADAMVSWTWNTPSSNPMHVFLGTKYKWASEEKVAGDGSTIVNVYYTRYQFNYEFDFKAYYNPNTGNSHFSQDNIVFKRAPGEVYDTNNPRYRISVKYGQQVSELGEGVLDLWPGMDADISRSSDPRFYIGWGLHSGQFLHIPDWQSNLGVGSIGHNLVPRENGGADGSTAIVYPLFTASPILFDNNSFVTPGSWVDPSTYPDNVGNNDGRTYIKYPKGNYTLPGFARNLPSTSAPEGFTFVRNYYGNQSYADAFSYENAVKGVSSKGFEVVRIVTLGLRKSFEMTFAQTGESVIGARTYEYEYPMAGQAPTDPVREGYEFAGWYTDQFYTEKFEWETATMPARNLVLYGKWLPRERSVTYFEKDGTELGIDYYANGDTIAEPTPTTLGSDIYVVGKITPGKGEFLGWQWRPSAGYAPFEKFGGEIHRDYALYANWGSEYEVVYDPAGANSGITPIDDMLYFSGTQVTVKDADLKKGGRALVGWRLLDGSATVRIFKPGDTFIIHDNVTLAAVYEPSKAMIFTSPPKKIYKDLAGSVQNKINLLLVIEAHESYAESNIKAATDIISLRYAFVPYDTNDPAFNMSLTSQSDFESIYAASSVTNKGNLVPTTLTSTGNVQTVQLEVDVEVNGRLVLCVENRRTVSDGIELKFDSTGMIHDEIKADNVYTTVDLHHKGIGERSSGTNVDLYAPTQANVEKTNDDSAHTGAALDRSLYGLPLDAQGEVIVSPQFGYDQVAIKSYEAVGDVGLPSGIKPFWKFKLPQEKVIPKEMNNVSYLAGYTHTFLYEQNAKPIKFFKVDSAKNGIKTDVAEFEFKNSLTGGKVLDASGQEQDRLLLSTTLTDPSVVVPAQLPGEYKLTETKAPSGFNLLTRDIVVTIDNQGNIEAKIGSVLLESVSLEGSDINTYAAAYYIINKTAAELPAAGGVGFLFTALLSAVVFLLAMSIFLRRGRLRHE